LWILGGRNVKSTMQPVLNARLPGGGQDGYALIRVYKEAEYLALKRVEKLYEQKNGEEMCSETNTTRVKWL